MTTEFIQSLLSSPDTPRDVLRCALQESQRQFESVLSCISGTFYRCELSPPWKMEFISSGIEDITGFDSGFFAETPYGDLIESEDMSALEQVIDEAIAGHTHFTAFYRVRHKSGGVRWVHEHGKAIYDAEGRALFLEGYISDVTETKRLEAEAEKSGSEIEKLNKEMSRILKGTLDAIVSTDHDGNYTFANDVYHEISHTDPGIIGKKVADLFENTESLPLWQEIQQVKATNAPLLAEFISPRLNEWFEVYIVPDDDGLTCFFRNISVRKRLEAALTEQADTLRATLDHVPTMLWTTRPDGQMDFFNTPLQEFTGQMLDDMADNSEFSFDSLFHPDDTTDVLQEWYDAIEKGLPYELEFRLRHHSGDYRWVLARAWPQRDESGSIVRWSGACTDIHERVLAERELQESQKLRDNILDASSDCILVVDLDGTLTEMNVPGLQALDVEDPATVIGQHWPDLWASRSRESAQRALEEARTGSVSRFTGFCPTSKGEPKWWDVIVTPIRDADSKVSSLLCMSRDITEQRASAERLRIASEQDSLTMLPNRRVFERHLKQITAKASESGTNIGLMLLDLDYFKHVNDSLGHLAGDHLLQVIAHRLKGCVRANNGFVARLGGDEFAVVLDDIQAEQELTETASRILASIEVPVTYAGKLIDGGVSIGCAMYPRDATDAQDLFKVADTALYDLKTSGRGGVQMFSSQMMEAAERSATQLTLARRVINEDAVQPHYQPKVHLDSGEVAGFEALLRWWCPDGGIQPPSTVAEAFCDYELSTKIGNLMQGRVIADMRAWLNAGLNVKPVSINASPAEFLRDDYAERLLERLDQARIPHSLIEIEITEHAFLERRSEHVIRALYLLNRAGVRIALDDFGTGYSSLSHLRDFPVNVLKIDRSFVSRMHSEPTMRAIVQAITRLGPSLSLDIVAEGVETMEQFHALREAGCRYGQGYLFGEAMDAGELTQRLATGEWRFNTRSAA